jgi:peroxiredoxin
MKPKFLILLALISSMAGGNLKSQIEDSSYVVIEDSSYFVVKGKVMNAGGDLWELCSTTYFNNDVWKVPISGGGTFAKRIPIRGIQDVYLYLNDDAITINAFPGDTIELYWDERDFINTFKIGSNNPMRNTDLQMNLKLYKAFRESSLALRDTLHDQKHVADSLKFSWINDYLNQTLKFILADSGCFTQTTAKFITDTYYSCLTLLRSNNLFGQFSLKINDDMVNPGHSNEISSILEEGVDSRLISYNDFSRSAEYRDFLFNYIRSDTNLPAKKVTRAFVMQEYQRCLSNVGAYVIRDWLACNIIMKGFEFYPYEDCEWVYNDFIGICKTDLFKDSLINYHDFVKHFKPGETAPNFVLKDSLDNYVSLRDFRGKAVYIDFWGVGCSPCRSDISRFVPKLHEKYKDKDVVFVNICVDSNVKAWKKAIKDLKLDGINLIAEGWGNNPVCRLYNINAIPHYIILDREGRYVTYNGDFPWKLVDETFNNLDRALLEL